MLEFSFSDRKKEKTMEFDIKDINQADKGKLRIEWAGKFMPVLENIKKEFKERRFMCSKDSCFKSQRWRIKNWFDNETTRTWKT